MYQIMIITKAVEIDVVVKIIGVEADGVEEMVVVVVVDILDIHEVMKWNVTVATIKTTIVVKIIPEMIINMSPEVALVTVVETVGILQKFVTARSQQIKSW